MDEFEFDGQRSDEKVILVKTQHPWVLAKPAFVVIAIILVTFIIFLTINSNYFRLIVFILALAFTIFYIVSKWFVYNHGVFILTNQRLINVEQRGFFSRRVSETELDNIYNVAYETKGLVSSLLNFGEVQISTFGDELSTILLKNVENPHFVQEKIVSNLRKYKKQSGLIN